MLGEVIGRRIIRRLLPRRLALAIRRETLIRRIVNERAPVETDIRFLSQFVRATDVCWDIGANAGMYTVPLSRLAAKVIAFEPIPHSFEILEAVARRGRLKNVSLRREAIADIDGPGRMRIPVNGFYGGFYLATLDEAGEVPVTLASIDALVARGVAEPDFIKCDVEGAEVRVIDGARALIARRHPIWLLETFQDRVPPLMESLGYTAYVQGAEGRLEPARARVPEHRNYFFVAAAGHAARL